jgi:hypothetical protein
LVSYALEKKKSYHNGENKVQSRNEITNCTIHTHRRQIFNQGFKRVGNRHEYGVPLDATSITEIYADC